MNAQPQTKSHESFYDRLARIEHSHTQRAAGSRASSRMRRSTAPKSRRLRGVSAPVVQSPRHITSIAPISVVARLKCWSFGFLLGGLLTLVKVAVLSPALQGGVAGFSKDVLYISVFLTYVFFCSVALVGLLNLRRKTGFGQFSIALVLTLVLGLI